MLEPPLPNIRARGLFFDKQPESREIWRYSEFIHQVEKGKVVQVRLSPDGSRALVKLLDSSPVIVYLPEDPSLNRILTDNNVDMSVLPQTNQGLWLKALGTLVPLASLVRHLLLRRDVDQLKAGSDRSR